MDKTQTVDRWSFIGATLLVGGTCIGGGMLALPVETGIAGFFPSLLVMILCWAYMTYTGLLLVEANLWMEEGAHTMTMASRLLGRGGKFASMFLYLFMGYGSLIAYNSGGSGLITNFIQGMMGTSITRFESCVLFAILFGSMIYLGTRLIGRVNALLVTGMIVAYFIMIGNGLGETHFSLLSHRNWSHSFITLPLVLTTFSFQMIVPSLTPYLKRDPTSLRKAIIYGTTIPFVIYAMWQWIVLGIVPIEGSHGLGEAFVKGITATQSLKYYVMTSWLSVAAEYFAFFALVTSYLGIALGMYDFISDSMKIRKKGMGKLSLGLIIIIPSLLVSIYYPRAFLFALEITGGFGDTLLNGILPVMMVWVGRYIKHHEGPYTVSGGKKSLLLIIAFSLVVFAVQILNLFRPVTG